MQHFRPIQSVKVYEQVLQQIKDLATQGLLKVGDRLPAERTLAEQLGVSRSSVREGFSVLETLGLIENRLGEGKVVVSTSFTVLTDFISLARSHHGSFRRDLAEARLSLEPGLAAMAAERCTEDDLTRMGRALAELQAAAAVGRFDRQADRRFQTALAEAGGNSVLSRLASLVYELWWERANDPAAGELVRWVETYQTVYQAVVDRAPEAARAALRQHLLRSVAATQTAG